MTTPVYPRLKITTNMCKLIRCKKKKNSCNFITMPKFLPLFLPLLFLFLSTPLQSVAKTKCNYKQLGYRCAPPSKEWQRDGTCFANKTKAPFCLTPHSREFSFLLVIAMATTLSHELPENLWIVGTGPGLSWDKSSQLKKLEKGYWGLHINYTYNSDSLLCYNQSQCSLNQKAVEFRVYADSTRQESMLGPNFYVRLPVSNSIINGPNFKPPLVYFFPHFEGKKVVTQSFRFDYPTHLKPVNKYIDVTLMYPPSYLYNIHKRYPVVIVFGDNFHLQLSPLLESVFVHESNAEEAFIVVVHNSGPPPYCTYNPFMVVENSVHAFSGNYVWNCQNGDANCLRCMDACYSLQKQGFCSVDQFSIQVGQCNVEPKSCEGRGGAILDLIENVVLPELAFQTTSRMLIDYPRERISIIGIDGGGLLACMAALFRPLVFKNAACLSAPFHWPLRSITVRQSREKQGIGLLLNQVAERIRVRKGFSILYSTQKYYIDQDVEDNKYLPIVDTYNYSDWVVSNLRRVLRLDSTNLMYFTISGRGYGNSYIHLTKDGDYRLLNRVKNALTFFLKPEGGYSATYSRMLQIGANRYIDHKITLERSNIKFDNKVKSKNSTPDCEKHLPKLPPSVSISVFYYSIVSVIVVSAVSTCILMEIRKHLMRSTAEAEELEEDSVSNESQE